MNIAYGKHYNICLTVSANNHQLQLYEEWFDVIENFLKIIKLIN